MFVCNSDDSEYPKMTVAKLYLVSSNLNPAALGKITITALESSNCGLYFYNLPL